MKSLSNEFDLVTPCQFRQAHDWPEGDNELYTTNMLAISIEKSDVEGISDDGRVQTQSVPRITIQVDSVFVNLDDLAQKAKDALLEHFEFV